MSDLKKLILRVLFRISWAFFATYTIMDLVQKWSGNVPGMADLKHQQDSLQAVIKDLNVKIEALDDSIKIDTVLVSSTKTVWLNKQGNVARIDSEVRLLPPNQLAKFFLDSVRVYGKQE